MYTVNLLVSHNFLVQFISVLSIYLTLSFYFTVVSYLSAWFLANKLHVLTNSNVTERLNDLTERFDWTSFHRRSRSATDDWAGMLDSSSPDWRSEFIELDVPNWLLANFKLLNELQLVTELKLEAEFVNHPDSLARRPIDPATASRTPNIMWGCSMALT